MSPKVSAGAGLPQALPPLADLKAPDVAAVDRFNAAIGSAGQRQEVTDAQLQEAIGNSIMQTMINQTFENMRRFKEAMKS